MQINETGAKKIIVSVKSGKNITRSIIADLKNTLERGKAHMGLFITLVAPTKPMLRVPDFINRLIMGNLPNCKF